MDKKTIEIPKFAESDTYKEFLDLGDQVVHKQIWAIEQILDMMIELEFTFFEARQLNERLTRLLNEEPRTLPIKDFIGYADPNSHQHSNG